MKREPGPPLEPSPPLGNLAPDEFFERYWQKRPALLRRAVTDAGTPITREELFTLASRPEVPSRLITAPAEGSSWTVHRGPFSERDLDGLPARGWTLLVQEVDRHNRAAAALLERFRFVPNWRIDDVMVSYATDGGGVGPHIDRYDVFLLQSRGRRRWRITTEPLVHERLSSQTELPVLAEFNPDEEWLLDEGDMLYLPPRIAHEGTAVGECMTCSIGFRVPDPRELCSSFLRQLGPQAFDRIRYSDPELRYSGLTGEIPLDARRQLRERAIRLFSEAGEFDSWLGRFVTRPLRGPGPDESSPITSTEYLARFLDRGGRLRRSAPPHFAWLRDDDGAVQLFVGGESYPLGPGADDIAELLCGRGVLDRATLLPHLADESVAEILVDLMLRGFLQPRTS